MLKRSLKMKPQEEPDPSLTGVRPIPITVLCVLFLIGGIFLGASNLVPGISREISSKVAFWYPAYLVGFSASSIVCVVGLWRMKAWGFISYGIVAAVNQLVMVFVGDWRPSNLILVAVFYFLLVRYFPRTRKNPKP